MKHNMKKQIWLIIEKLKKYFWCAYFHREHRCYPEVWGRGLAGPWHCSKCHECGEAFDVIAGKPIKGLLWDQIIEL